MELLLSAFTKSWRVIKYNVSPVTVFAFIFGVSHGVRIGALGGSMLLLSEVFALVFVVLYFFSTKFKIDKTIFRLGLAALGLGLSFVISGFLNGTSLISITKSVASVIFFWVSLTAIFYMVKNAPGNIVLILIGYGLVLIISPSNDFDLSTTAAHNYFKVRHQEWVLIFLALLASLLYTNWPRVAALILFLGGLFCFSMGARSAGLVLLFACYIVFTVAPGKGSTSHSAAKPVMGILAAIAIFSTVGFVLSGQQPAADMSGGSSDLPWFINLLLLGRTEVFVGILAAIERPIIGYGPWAVDVSGKFSQLIFVLRDNGLTGDFTRYIPTHSVIVGSWVWGGVLGLLSILYIARRFFLLVLSAIKIRHYMLPLIGVICGMSLWHFVFSPIGHIRITLPMSFGILFAHYLSSIKKPVHKP